MPSTYLFILGTLLLSLNAIRLGSFALSDWCYLGAISFAFLETAAIKRQKRHWVCWFRNRFIWMAFFVATGALISTTRATFTDVALVELAQQLFVMTVFVSLSWIMVRRGRTKNVIISLIISGSFTALVAVIDKLTGSKWGPILSGTPFVDFMGRYAGTLGHPNKFGYFLVLTTLLTIGMVFEKFSAPLRKRGLIMLTFVVFLFIVEVFGLYLSNSMTAYLGFLLGCVLYGFSVIQRRKWCLPRATWVSILLLFSLALLGVSWLSSPFRLQGAVGFLFEAYQRVTTITAQSRMEVFQLAWHQIALDPWIGVGYDQISTSGTGLSQFLLRYSIHNSLFQIWYTGGVIAFIGWLALHINLFWSALRVTLSKLKIGTIPWSLVSLTVVVFSILLMDQFQDVIYSREKWLIVGLFMGSVWELREVRISA